MSFCLLILRHLVIILFPFLLTPAEPIVIGLPNKVGLVLLTGNTPYKVPLVLVQLTFSHQYIGAANILKRKSGKCDYWCCMFAFPWLLVKKCQSHQFQRWKHIIRKKFKKNLIIWKCGSHRRSFRSTGGFKSGKSAIWFRIKSEGWIRILINSLRIRNTGWHKIASSRSPINNRT
jgi:hypothetical protein